MMSTAMMFRGAPRQSNCTACSAIKQAASTSPLLRRRNASTRPPIARATSRMVRTVNPSGQCQGAWCEITKGGGDLAAAPRRSGVQRAPVRQIAALRSGVNPATRVGVRTTPPSRASNCWWTETGWLCCATGDTPWPKCVAGGMTSPGSGSRAPTPRLGARVSNPAPQYVTKPALRNLAMSRSARGLVGGSGPSKGGGTGESSWCGLSGDQWGACASCYHNGQHQMCCVGFPDCDADGCFTPVDCFPIPPGGGGGGSQICGTPGNPPCPPETQPPGPGIGSTRFGGFTTSVGVAPRTPFYSGLRR